MRTARIPLSWHQWSTEHLSDVPSERWGSLNENRAISTLTFSVNASRDIKMSFEQKLPRSSTHIPSPVGCYWFSRPMAVTLKKNDGAQIWHYKNFRTKQCIAASPGFCETSLCTWLDSQGNLHFLCFSPPGCQKRLQKCHLFWCVF